MHWATRPVYAISRIGLHGCTSRRFALGVHASPGPPSFLSMQVVSRLPFTMSSVPDSELKICTNGSPPFVDGFSRVFSFWLRYYPAMIRRQVNLFCRHVAFCVKAAYSMPYNAKQCPGFGTCNKYTKAS